MRLTLSLLASLMFVSAALLTPTNAAASDTPRIELLDLRSCASCLRVDRLTTPNLGTGPELALPPTSVLDLSVSNHQSDRTTDSLDLLSFRKGERPWVFVRSNGKRPALLEREPPAQRRRAR